MLNTFIKQVGKMVECKACWAICQRILHECSCFIEFIKHVGKNRSNARLVEHFIAFSNSLNKFNNLRARMLVSIDHMTLKLINNRFLA